jgi:hypothetical protein
MVTYLIQAPPYIFAYFVTLLVSWSSGRFLEHCWHICASMFACLVGAVIMISTLNVGARYFSMFLLCTGPFIGLNVSQGINSSRRDNHTNVRNRFKSPGNPALCRVPEPSVPH